MKSSLLVRSYPTRHDEPDAAPARSGRLGNGSPEAVIPGTSVGGAYRQRALQIARTLEGKGSSARTDALITGLFGPATTGDLKARAKNREQTDSRVIFQEAAISGGVEEVQSRIHIDPLTGGVLSRGLFEEQAVWSGKQPAGVTLRLRLRDPDDAEVALLLQVAKDLWTEDLPLGGGVGIGRGVLQGRELELCSFREGKACHRVTMKRGAGAEMSEEAREWLRTGAEALVRRLRGGA